ncbi:MAG: TIGR01244 family sulfur transferase [Pseudomonadota bacterium]
MLQYEQITEQAAVAPQITPDDLPALKEAGFTVVINNRPDHEEPGQPEGAVIEAAAKAVGLRYYFIPVAGFGPSMEAVDAFKAALDEAQGPVLAYCRSGARSASMLALVEGRR